MDRRGHGLTGMAEWVAALRAILKAGAARMAGSGARSPPLWTDDERISAVMLVSVDSGAAAADAVRWTRPDRARSDRGERRQGVEGMQGTGEAGTGPVADLVLLREQDDLSFLRGRQ
jgi:hypothetical protein